jgi:hypothetical protein
MLPEDSLECLEASIACTGHGKTAHLLGKVYTKGVMDIAVSGGPRILTKGMPRQILASLLIRIWSYRI